MTEEFYWIAEEINLHGDVLETHRHTTRAAAEDQSKDHPDCHSIAIALVRETLDKETQELESREWAYVTNGVLSAKFTDGTFVPAAFILNIEDAKVFDVSPTSLHSALLFITAALQHYLKGKPKIKAEFLINFILPKFIEALPPGFLRQNHVRETLANAIRAEMDGIIKSQKD